MRGSALILDLYELTMAEVYFRRKRHGRATFDLFARCLPRNRSFLLAAGLSDILDYIGDLRFRAEDLDYLRGLGLFSKEFLRYLRSFRFSGDIWAMAEGTVFFPNEPVLRVTAPIMEAQIIEGFLLNTINLQTMIASKAARVVLAARGRPVYDFSLRRTHGSDASLKVARSSYLAGFSGTSNVLAGKKYGIGLSGTMAHSFVMAFDSEWESFQAYAEVFPDRTILLVDTYDTRNGIRNAISAARRLSAKGHKLAGIRLDSGDLAAEAFEARKMLDSAGLKHAKIVGTGNLDERAISALIDKGAPIDSFGVGTHMGTSSDAPVLDVIYKMSEVTGDDGKFFPVMKFSKGKTTLPGRKQIYRVLGHGGGFRRDIVGLEGEAVRGEKLLVPVVRKGRIIYKQPSLDRSRALAVESLARLPERLGSVKSAGHYSVTLSAKLSGLRARLAQGYPLRQGTVKNAVFLDIDTQRDFMLPSGALYVNRARTLLPALKRITAIADKHGIPIVSSMDWHCPADPEFKCFGPHCVQNSAGARKISATVAGATKQVFVRKCTYDIFSNPEAAWLLKDYTEVYVYGVALDYCVKAACLGALKLGHRVYLIKDAVKAVTPENSGSVARLLRNKGVVMISTRSLKRRLGL